MAFNSPGSDTTTTTKKHIKKENQHQAHIVLFPYSLLFICSLMHFGSRGSIIHVPPHPHAFIELWAQSYPFVCLAGSECNTHFASFLFLEIDTHNTRTHNKLTSLLADFYTVLFSSAPSACKWMYFWCSLCSLLSAEFWDR